jgi:hypothetical protein
MLKVRFAAEVLPVRILRPLRHDFFIRQVAGVFQVIQANHQAYRYAAAAFFRIQIAKLCFRCIPIDLSGELVQCVTLIEHLIQAQPEQVCLGYWLCFAWFYIARNPYSTCRIPANPASVE